MLAAERAGAIAIRTGRREREHLIERVTVSDTAALARHLGRAPAPASAKEARDRLETAIADSPSWLKTLLDDAEKRWARGESAFRLQPEETEATHEFFTLLRAISKDQARGLDARTFSLKVTGDSKAFDRHAMRIAGVMATQFGGSRLKPQLVWERIGLERFRHPIHLRGPILVENAGGILVDGRAKPFASIHPEMLPFAKLSAQPQLLLTIENYASFNRYVRDIEDGGIVIYTGGFASAGVIDLLMFLLTEMNANIPFLHWGDIDPGGLRIFRFLEENLPRKPRPHLMERSFAEAHGRPAARDPTLEGLAKSDSAVANVAEWLAYGANVKHLEQEAIDPVRP